jgi:ketosteroid isomerase-like protein
MTESTSPALDVALAYYHSWTGHDLERAMSYIAEDIVCDAPAGRLEGADAYRNSWARLCGSSSAQNSLPPLVTTRRR